MNDVNYSESLLRQDYARRQPIRDALKVLIHRYALKDRDVVELGSGLGHNLRLFAEDNRVLGIEGLHSASDQATNTGIRTICSDLSAELPLGSENFDVVLCLDVLEHLLYPEQCLAEARRILRCNGLLVVNVPNHFSLSGRINVVRGAGIDSLNLFPSHADWQNPHVRFFRHSSILKLLASCGFKVIDDWSRLFPSIPILSKIPAVQRSRVARIIAARAPEIFAGGFFILARRF